MKYLIFAGDCYYPYGGWGDYVGSAGTLEDALTTAANHKGDWWQIVDAETYQIVKTSYSHD